jgi:hypothetical protein
MTNKEPAPRSDQPLVVQKAVKVVGTGVEIGLHAFSTPVIVDIKITCAFAIGGSSPVLNEAIERAACADDGDSEQKWISAHSRVDRYV